MDGIGIKGWSEYVEEGRRYFKTAQGGRKRAAVFNNELLANLIGLSLEKFLVGLCLRHGHLPADHTLGGIVAEVQRLCPMDAALAEEIMIMDRVQDLCSLDVHMPCAASDRRIEMLLSMNEHVAAFVEEKV
ncbi:MAG: hypothetical protein HZB87_06755 [Desulfatitalea sp.]|nr:hypothetical protein [Desulfatitalea sp.]